ncbi:hypothetical protein I545_5806 [Mycobacterium kansasii 662]|uniref:Uncharacterized protein n=2 Tax=Mycobacterium kansasii TaxID=1768 RepID=A0A1V3X6H6_MYCKA|nr:hypothetical protein I547_6729 [Mycobacterium kansasii 824]EUA10352.1 hypothetical protein I545_5806 [Mycobacterium kansasii 662]OOK70446.1 hypothetical protein BZL30_6553 [Mycobacterium kansasii]OOK74728.1 hypothetical protein BZL29_4536 [Mycobacterium kansasii]
MHGSWKGLLGHRITHGRTGSVVAHSVAAQRRDWRNVTKKR